MKYNDNWHRPHFEKIRKDICKERNYNKYSGLICPTTIESVGVFNNEFIYTPKMPQFLVLKDL